VAGAGGVGSGPVDGCLGGVAEEVFCAAAVEDAVKVEAPGVQIVAEAGLSDGAAPAVEGAEEGAGEPDAVLVLFLGGPDQRQGVGAGDVEDTASVRLDGEGEGSGGVVEAQEVEHGVEAQRTQADA
jgi:hypothetical protein